MVMIKVHKPLVAESLGFVFWLGANPLSKISLNYITVITVSSPFLWIASI